MLRPNKDGYMAGSWGRWLGAENAYFPTFQVERDGSSNRPTDRSTERPTNQLVNRQTDRQSLQTKKKSKRQKKIVYDVLKWLKMTKIH